MKLKMMKTVPGSRDGGRTETFNEGAVYSFDESLPREMELVETFVSSGFGTKVSDAEAASHEKAMAEAAVAANAKAREERKAARDEKKAAKAAKASKKDAKTTGEGADAPPAGADDDQKPGES